MKKLHKTLYFKLHFHKFFWGEAQPLPIGEGDVPSPLSPPSAARRPPRPQRHICAPGLYTNVRVKVASTEVI